MCYFPGTESIRLVFFLLLLRGDVILLIYTDMDFADGSFTLKSSKGLCAFEDDALNCGSHVSKASEFTVCRVSQPCVFLFSSMLISYSKTGPR